MSEKPQVLADVFVDDFKNEIVENATVTLSRVREEDRRKAKAGDRFVELRFDKSTRSYRGEVPAFGAYLAKVKAKGYAPDERDIRIEPRGARERFTLGRRGMPFYFRGNAKVPFDPDLADLLGVTFGPDAPEDAVGEFKAVLGEYGVKEDEIPAGIKRPNFHIFGIPENAGEEARREIFKHIGKIPWVRIAWPLIHRFPHQVTFLNNDFIARFHTLFPPRKVTEIADRYSMRVIRRFNYVPNAYLLRVSDVPPLKALAKANQLADDPATIYVEPNFVHLTANSQIDPGDPMFGGQWHLGLNIAVGDVDINVPSAWDFLRGKNALSVQPNAPGDITFGSEDVVIAIFDEGVRSLYDGATNTEIPEHGDFSGSVTSGADKIYGFYDTDAMVLNNSTVDDEHGIQVAGIAAALAGNIGVAGIAGNCPVMAVKRPQNPIPVGAETYRYADAFVWMAGFDPSPGGEGEEPPHPDWPSPPNPGADVVNCSFFFPDSSFFADTLDFLKNFGRNGRGTIVVFAAGNAAALNPAVENIASVIGVAATDQQGNEFDAPPPNNLAIIAAPGQNILTTALSQTRVHHIGQPR